MLAPVKNVHVWWCRLLRKAFIAGPLRLLAAFRGLGDGRNLLFRISSVGVTEGERGPAMLELVASALVVTGAEALVAGVAAGRSPPPVSSCLSQCRCPRLPVALLLGRRLGRIALLHCQLRNGRVVRLQRGPSAVALAASPLVRQVAMLVIWILSVSAAFA